MPDIKWSEETPPNDSCSYDHVIGETVFGRFLLTWKGWKEYPEYGFDETPWNEVIYDGWDSVEDAKHWAEVEFLVKIDIAREHEFREVMGLDKDDEIEKLEKENKLMRDTLKYVLNSCTPNEVIYEVVQETFEQLDNK